LRITHGIAMQLWLKRIADQMIKARANKTITGNLQKKLDAEKKLSQRGQLAAASNANRTYREIDAINAEAQHR